MGVAPPNRGAGIADKSRAACSAGTTSRTMHSLPQHERRVHRDLMIKLRNIPMHVIPDAISAMYSVKVAVSRPIVCFTFYDILFL
jgi:hypothetical protein